MTRKWIKVWMDDDPGEIAVEVSPELGLADAVLLNRYLQRYTDQQIDAWLDDPEPEPESTAVVDPTATV